MRWLPAISRSFLYVSAASVAWAGVRTTALSQPVQAVFSPAHVPDTQISIRSQDAADGGLTAEQLQQLQGLLRQIPPAHLKGISNIVFIPHGQLMKLPGVSSRSSTGIAYADSGNLFFNDTVLLDHSWLSNVLHELGHPVEAHGLTGAERRAWERLHESSKNPLDFISAYARSSAREDFAETYLHFTRGAFADAVELARKGHGGLLRKMLFMSAFFTSFTPGGAATSFFVPDPKGESLYVSVAVPAGRHAGKLEMGGYTFALSGEDVVRISDADGGVLASHLAIPVSEVLFAHLTRPAAPRPKPPAVVRRPPPPEPQAPAAKPTPPPEPEAAKPASKSGDRWSDIKRQLGLP